MPKPKDTPTKLLKPGQPGFYAGDVDAYVPEDPDRYAEMLAEFKKYPPHLRRPVMLAFRRQGYPTRDIGIALHAAGGQAKTREPATGETVPKPIQRVLDEGRRRMKAAAARAKKVSEDTQSSGSTQSARSRRRSMPDPDHVSAPKPGSSLPETQD